MKPKSWVWFLCVLATIVTVVLLAVPSALPYLQRQLQNWAAPTSQQEPESPGVPVAPVPAIVAHVHDGDTLFIDYADGTQIKVRMIGIDTPEIGDNAECYGDEATSLLRELLPEGSSVLAVADRDELDQYGRSLLYLYANDELINLTMIERGAAEAVVIGNNDRFADDLFAAEDAARSGGLGMWGAC